MHPISRLVFASGNAGKAREICAILGGSVEIVLQGDLGVESIEETGTTFAENALLKARHAAQLTRLPALADDSGLEVDFLAGAPGVHSARYAGEAATDQANRDKLLHELDGVPETERGARFRCALAFVRDTDDPAPLIIEACWEGRIALTARGMGGFGYDALFIDESAGCTSAELSAEAKNARSHRGKALAILREELLQLGLLLAA